MIVRNEPTDPMQMTPEERVRELAAILAAGVLRLHRRAAITPNTGFGGNTTALEIRSRGLIGKQNRRRSGSPWRTRTSP